MFAHFSEAEEWLEGADLTQHDLPHFFYKKLYQWSYDFILTKNRRSFVCGANQISKTSTMIRKNIFLATSPHLWSEYFNRDPQLFWYFYPDRKVLNEEWGTKWMEWMPRVPKNHPYYEYFGWEKIIEEQKFVGILFRTGVRLSFRFYSMKVDSVQSSSVDMISGDEEIPVPFVEEMEARMFATEGILNSGFTATKGQEYWHDVIEKQGMLKERFPDAFKRVVSAFDCLKYIDGSAGEVWNEEKIYKKIAEYTRDGEVDENMILRRIMGRFVQTTGLAFESYKREKVSIPKLMLSRSFDYYLIVDPGSGGRTGHPTGILFLAVDNVKNIMYVVSAWRGDGILTTSNTIVTQMLTMSGTYSVTALIYDGAAADFLLTAQQEVQDMAILAANKKRDNGFARVNSYLEAGAICIPEESPVGAPWWDKDEIEKLHLEFKITRRLETATGAKKGTEVDDLTDCVRYACMHIHIPLDLVAREDLDKDGSDKPVYIHGRYKVYKEDLAAQETRDPRYNDWVSQFNRLHDCFPC